MYLREYIESKCEIIPSVNLLRLKKSDEAQPGLVKAYLPQIDALIEGFLDISKCKVLYIPKEQLKYCLQKGDILIKCQNETLMTIVDNDNVICSSYAIGVRLKHKQNLYELVSTLTSNEFYKIGNLSRVSLVNRINTSDIMNYTIKPSVKKGELIYKTLELELLLQKLYSLQKIVLEEELKKIKKLDI